MNRGGIRVTGYISACCGDLGKTAAACSGASLDAEAGFRPGVVCPGQVYLGGVDGSGGEVTWRGRRHGRFRSIVAVGLVPGTGGCFVCLDFVCVARCHGKSGVVVAVAVGHKCIINNREHGAASPLAPFHLEAGLINGIVRPGEIDL